jgi:L-iditol 2-dehydrogenase
MLEPVNTILKAVNRLNLLPGDAVLVAGQGPVGLMFTKILQLRGIRVLATDMLESRLKLAKKFGAKWTLNVGQASRLPSERASARDASALPMRSGGTPALHSTSLDAAVIAVPSDAAAMQALQLVRAGGQVLLFAHTKRGAHASGVPFSASRRKSFSSIEKMSVPEESGVTSDLAGGTPALPFSLDPATICVDEKDLIGSYSSDFTLQSEVARLVFSRRLDVRALITHRFPLEETAAAVALAASPQPDSLKIIVDTDSR